MNILFLSLSFSTQSHKSFYEDLLLEFQKAGHLVYVACANEKKSAEQNGIEKKAGLTILRIPIGNMTGNISVIEKGISTVTIDSKFKTAVKKEFANIKFDLIMYPTPPITLVETITYMKKKNRAKTYLLLKDIFPQNAIDLGMMSKTGVKGFIYKYFRKKEKKLYNISDYIGCMSPANCKYVITHNPEVNPKKVEVCPNCVVPCTSEKKIEEVMAIRRKYDVPIDKKVFVYGGNLGKPQGINFILECIGKCKDIKEAFFLIVGGGAEAGKISKYIKENNVKNAMLIGTLPKTDYQLLANSCDVGLVFLDYRFTIPNFPSRLLSYMQASMPVLVATDPNTDMGDIVEQNGFGWKCMSNNTDEFIKCIEKGLSLDLQPMGKRGHEYLETYYSVKKGYEIIMEHFR